MDPSQIDTLGSKMRDAYDDVAAAPAEPAPKHPSTRLRKNRYVTSVASAKAGAAKAADAAPSAAGSVRGFARQRPFTTLMIAAGTGYLLAKLSR